MGYTTDFEGSVAIEPPLNEHEIKYLQDLAGSRRMHRTLGPYYAEQGDDFGQRRDRDILDYNRPDPTQPGLWLQWAPSEDGTALAWDGGEKFYYSPEWMAYVIDTFLKPGATVSQELLDPKPGWFYPEAFKEFTFDHVLNGTIIAEGEDDDDRWDLVVEDNAVTVDPH